MWRKLLIVIGLGALVMFAYTNRVELLSYVASLSRGELSQRFLTRVSQESFLPGPLRARVDAAQSHLMADGVVKWTNQQRAAENLGVLHVNEKLNAAAELKLRDMFAQQYFEHVSPQGVAPADLAKQVGYAYILVGENLALGNFKDDQTLVQAWMDSPGHRANILHHRFQEIGVAVGQSTYEGRTVWMAVQEFGKPLSSCPAVSSGLKQQIDVEKAQIETLSSEATNLRTAIENGEYNHNQELKRQKVEEYNQMVSELNELISRSQRNIADYNQEVERFNQCLEDND